MAIARAALGGNYPPMDPHLAQVYRSIMLDLVERAKQRLVSDPRRLTAEAHRARALIRELRPILEDADTLAAQWIAENVPKSYLRGVSIANKGFREIGAPAIAGMDTAFHQEAIQVLTNNLIDDLTEITANAERGMRTLVRKTQLTAARDKLLTQEVVKGIGAGKARREVSKSIAQRLLDEYKDKPIRINGRNYQIDKYAELVARTMTREAQTAGTVNRVVEAGEDLVMVTAHGAKDGCGFYEGKVFSVSGTSGKYPGLDELPNGGPPFHPNCRHSLAPYIEDLASGAEKRRAGGVPQAALGKSYADVEKLAKGAN